MKLYQLKLRCGWLLVAALVVIAVVAQIAPQQLGVAAWKLSVILAGGFVGYWIDRHVFPYARPHILLEQYYKLYHTEAASYAGGLFSAAMIRRSIVVAATTLAFALAL